MSKNLKNKKVRYGIAGVGGFGAKRRQTLRESGAFTILGGVDPQSDTFIKAEEEEGVALKRYASIEEMVADPQIEAVVISTPAALHVPMAMIAARAGKAIFCEKPLGHDHAECLELVTYCEQNKIPHGHGFGSRYAPIWQEVKRYLHEGVLGEIVSVSAASMQTSGLALEADNWRFEPKKNPGGPLYQCGIHKIDILRFLFGEGRWLSGVVQRRITATPTDDAYVLLGEFGEVPTTFHSHYVASYRHAMEIYGTRGDLFITEFPTKLEHKMTDLTSGFEPIHDRTASIPPCEAEQESLRDFAQAVRERRQPLMSGREGLRSLELVFEAARIAEEIPLKK